MTLEDTISSFKKCSKCVNLCYVCENDEFYNVKCDLWTLFKHKCNDFEKVE